MNKRVMTIILTGGSTDVMTVFPVPEGRTPETRVDWGARGSKKFTLPSVFHKSCG